MFALLIFGLPKLHTISSIGTTTTKPFGLPIGTTRRTVVPQSSIDERQTIESTKAIAPEMTMASLELLVKESKYKDPYETEESVDERELLSQYSSGEYTRIINFEKAILRLAGYVDKYFKEINMVQNYDISNKIEEHEELKATLAVKGVDAVILASAFGIFKLTFYKINRLAEEQEWDAYSEYSANYNAINSQILKFLFTETNGIIRKSFILKNKENGKWISLEYSDKNKSLNA